METVGISIDLDWDYISPAQVPDLIAALSKYSPEILSAVIVPDLQQIEEDAFSSQGGSIGVEWPPLAPRTIRDKKALGYGDQPPLVRTGKLRDAIGQTIDVSGNAVTVGLDTNEVPYARAQNYGYAPSNLPARLFMSMTPGQVQGMVNDVQAFLSQQTGLPPEAFIVSSQT